MRKSEIAKKCVVCSTEFYPWYNRLDQPTCGKASCRYESRKNKIKFICAHCGAESERIPSELDHRDNYCSRECMYKKQSIDRKGEGSPWVYKRGYYINEAGYKIIKVDGRNVPEHIYIMEQLLGRRLHSWEVVHHDNEVKADNDPKNLIVMPRLEHSKLHNKRRIAKGGFNGSGRAPGKLNLTVEEMKRVRDAIELKYLGLP